MGYYIIKNLIMQSRKLLPPDCIELPSALLPTQPSLLSYFGGPVIRGLDTLASISINGGREWFRDPPAPTAPLPNLGPRYPIPDTFIHSGGNRPDFRGPP